MRQRMSEKNTKRIARKLNLPVVGVLVRGGTDHRKDLLLEDGSVMHYYSNGETEKSDMKWRQES